MHTRRVCALRQLSLYRCCSFFPSLPLSKVSAFLSVCAAWRTRHLPLTFISHLSCRQLHASSLREKERESRLQRKQRLREQGASQQAYNSFILGEVYNDRQNISSMSDGQPRMPPPGRAAKQWQIKQQQHMQTQQSYTSPQPPLASSNSPSLYTPLSACIYVAREEQGERDDR